uniref:Uncharacterized protein n=1 Tax=Eutreptiella gymnastica TaxID=73025 RepID=A0A7S4LI47_9EUGL
MTRTRFLLSLTYPPTPNRLSPIHNHLLPIYNPLYHTTCTRTPAGVTHAPQILCLSSTSSCHLYHSHNQHAHLVHQQALFTLPNICLVHLYNNPMLMHAWWLY